MAEPYIVNYELTLSAQKTQHPRIVGWIDADIDITVDDSDAWVTRMPGLSKIRRETTAAIEPVAIHALARPILEREYGSFDIMSMSHSRTFEGSSDTLPKVRIFFDLIVRGEASEGSVEDSMNPLHHLEAEHSVGAYYDEATVAFLTADASGNIGIYDTQSLESGPTTEIRCRTCDKVLDLYDEHGDPYA